MSKGMPSLVALLGLLAVAGYQNRDRIGQALGSLKAGGVQTGQTDGLGGLLSGLGGLFGEPGTPSASGENVLTAGLRDLMNSFKTTGHGDIADSWVKPGVPTQGLTPDQVEHAIGTDNLAEISKRTGIPREELLSRLATAIPETVDRLTPEGEMPSENEARSRLMPTA